MKLQIAMALLWAATTVPALAEVKVEEPWVRATVPQQRVTGAFMRLTATRDARLISVQSPLAARAEIHEMVMERDIMKMRAVSAIALPAGKGVELSPGGFHIMLIDLKRAVRESETVSLVLVVQNADGKRESVEVAAPVRALNYLNAGSHVHRH